MDSNSTLQEIVCLELPLNVKNIDKAIDAVGGSSEISRVTSEAAFAKEPEGLQLKLREDRFHHPIGSAALPSKNIVIEIELPEICFNGDEAEKDIIGALGYAAQHKHPVNVTPKFHTKMLHRFRQIADFQYYTADSDFISQMNRSLFVGNLSEIQKLSLHTQSNPEDILPPPRFTLSTQPFYYGYKQSPYVKLVDDGSGERRLIHTSATAKVISNVLNWGDPVPNEPPSGLEENPRANIKQCIKELEDLFAKRPSYTRRSLQHKLGSFMSRYLKYALPYVSFYYRSGPWRGAYIKYGSDPSKYPELAKFQVEHFRIAADDQTSRSSGPNKDAKDSDKVDVKKENQRTNPGKEDYVFDGTSFPDVPLLQLSDIADGYLESFIDTDQLRPEVDMNDGWYTERTISIIRKVLRAELVALKDTKIPLPLAARAEIAESVLNAPNQE